MMRRRRRRRHGMGATRRMNRRSRRRVLVSGWRHRRWIRWDGGMHVVGWNGWVGWKRGHGHRRRRRLLKVVAAVGMKPLLRRRRLLRKRGCVVGMEGIGRLVRREGGGRRGPAGEVRVLVKMIAPKGRGRGRRGGRREPKRARWLLRIPSHRSSSLEGVHAAVALRLFVRRWLRARDFDDPRPTGGRV